VDQDAQAHRNACSLIRRLSAYEQIALILGSIEQDSPRREEAESLVLSLAQSLATDLDADPSARTVADIDVVRKQFLASLEVSVRRFAHHKANAVPEAYLLLADESSEIVRAALTEPGQSCHAPMVDAIDSSHDPRFFRWVMIALRWRHAPKAILQIISRRGDAWFANQFLGQIDAVVEPAVQHNLKLVRELAFLHSPAFDLASLSPQMQAAALILAIHTGISYQEKIQLVSRLLDDGAPEARRSAACGLALLQGTESARLVAACLEDDDAQVQLAATHLVRQKNLAHANQALIVKLGHPDDRVRQAARQALGDEFSFDKYVRNFDQMDETTQINLGELVAAVDESTRPRLLEMLHFDHRGQRLRGLRIVRALRWEEQLWEDLVKMLADDDHVVRRSAIEALENVRHPALLSSLESALEAGAGSAQEAIDHLTRVLAAER
jgi:HEAT repeat protein